MSRDDVAHLALAVVLTGIAGCVDAIGFLRLGHLFVSFMSGDSTQLAVAAADGKSTELGSAGGVVVLFVAGVVAGHVIGVWAKDWRRPLVLLVETVLLGLAVSLPPSGASMIVPMVVAMGVQNAAVHKAGDAKMSLTYVTGTLVSFGEKLVDAFDSSRPEERWAWVPYLLLWIGLVLGAVAGAWTYRRFGTQALCFPIIVLTLLALVTAGLVWRGKTASPRL